MARAKASAGKKPGSKPAKPNVRAVQASVPASEPPRDAKALREACEEGDLPRIAYEIAHGADPDGGGLGGRTPLLAAVHSGQLKAVQMLLAVGADPEKAIWFRSRKRTALIDACDEENGGGHAMAKALLDAGADPNGRVDGFYPLATAASWSEPIVKLLIERGASPGMHAKRFCCVKWAVVYKKDGIVKAMAAALSPADVAAGAGRAAMCALAGSDRDAESERGMRALLRAGVSPWLPIVEGEEGSGDVPMKEAAQHRSQWLGLLLASQEADAKFAKRLGSLIDDLVEAENSFNAEGIDRLRAEMPRVKARRERAALDKIASAVMHAAGAEPRAPGTGRRL